MRITNTILIIIIGIIINIKGYSQCNGNCTADFTYSIDNEISPLTYNFSDNSISTNPIIKWDWSFGNGQTSQLQNPNHQYLDEGDYLISLIVENDIGCIDTVSKIITVVSIPPPSCNAYFTFLRDTASANYTYIFTDHSIHTNDSIISWQWDFGDSSPLSFIQNPIHQYSSTGTYIVNLLINTINGYSSSYSSTIIINSGSVDCSASYTYSNDTTSSIANTIIFHDNSIHSSPILSWKWNFGDGDSSSYQDPSHHYPYAGIYNVTLNIVTANCSSEIEIPIQVGNPQKYNLWGRVYVGNLTTDQCIAYLYRKYNDKYIIPVDTVELTSVNDSLGVYYFYQVTEGDYKVQVTLPTTSQFHQDYAPTYFNNSVLWYNSQSINLISDLSLMNVHMEPILLQIGTNYISGSVVNQANGQLENVLVFLFNSQGDVINYTTTDSYGNYSFEDVPQGDYFVYGDLAGFASYPASINFNTNNDTLSNVNFLIKGRTSIGIVENDNIDDDLDVIIYPNPITNNLLSIRIQQKSNEDYKYIIYSSIGSEIQRGVLTRDNNKHTIELNSINKGVYFISIIDSSGRKYTVKKFIY